jgi:WD40 repeat protein
MITDGAPRVWDLATARYLNRPAGADKVGVTGTISDDGRVVVFNTEDRDDVTAWNVETGHVAKMTPGANDNARFALNPTGRLLAGSAPDGRIVIWDTTSGRIVRYIPGHAGPATALVFSADGKLLASGGADKITRIWDVATGQENLSLPGHFEPVNKILFSRDGQRLTTATRQGETLVYALDLKDLVAVARSRVTRAMTPEECRKFLHMESCSANPSRIARSEPTGARHLKRWNARGYVSGPRRGSFTEE